MCASRPRCSAGWRLRTKAPGRRWASSSEGCKQCTTRREEAASRARGARSGRSISVVGSQVVVSGARGGACALHLCASAHDLFFPTTEEASGPRRLVIQTSKPPGHAREDANPNNKLLVDLRALCHKSAARSADSELRRLAHAYTRDVSGLTRRPDAPLHLTSHLAGPYARKAHVASSS